MYVNQSKNQLAIGANKGFTGRRNAGFSGRANRRLAGLGQAPAAPVVVAPAPVVAAIAVEAKKQNKNSMLMVGAALAVVAAVLWKR